MRLREYEPTPIIYDAVLKLRRRELSVYRAGKDRHELDGAIVPTSWLLAEARNPSKAPVAEATIIFPTSDEEESAL